MHRRPATAIAIPAAVVLALGAIGLPAQGSTSVPSPSTADSYGTVLNIAPAGQRGSINAAQLAQVLAGGGTTAVDGKNAPPNYADQLEMYDRLNTQRPGTITNEVIDRDFKAAGFVPDKVVSTDKPRPGVTIVRDSYGVPFITGTTYEDTMFGAGFAGTQDRMFLMDALRHLGAGRGAEFVGGTPGNIAMDREQVRTAYYTPAEAADQLEIIAKENGAEGERLRGADAYLAGINAAQDAMCPLGLRRDWTARPSTRPCRRSRRSGAAPTDLHRVARRRNLRQGRWPGVRHAIFYGSWSRDGQGRQASRAR